MDSAYVQYEAVDHRGLEVAASSVDPSGPSSASHTSVFKGYERPFRIRSKLVLSVLSCVSVMSNRTRKARVGQVEVA